MDLYDLREQFDASGMMMCFNGPFSHSIIEELGTALRNYLAAENITRSAVLDVFAVYIELAQNVRNYITLREINQGHAAASIITIARWNNGYTISSGNMVLYEDVLPLCNRIKEIGNMTSEELKRSYKAQIRKDVQPGALGAGLGLLEIARHSSAPMACMVRDVDSTYSFFSLTAFV